MILVHFTCIRPESAEPNSGRMHLPSVLISAFSIAAQEFWGSARHFLLISN
jgi:hypothetical protein